MRAEPESLSASTFRVIEKAPGVARLTARRERADGQTLTSLGSDDEGLGGSVHQPAVPIDQVGHVLGNGQGRRCHCQRLRGTDRERAAIVLPATRGTAARDIRPLDAVKAGEWE